MFPIQLVLIADFRKSKKKTLCWKKPSQWRQFKRNRRVCYASHPLRNESILGKDNWCIQSYQRSPLEDWMIFTNKIRYIPPHAETCIEILLSDIHERNKISSEYTDMKHVPWLIDWKFQFEKKNIMYHQQYSQCPCELFIKKPPINN